MASTYARVSHCRNFSSALQIPALELETSSEPGTIGNHVVKDVQDA
jgi:hypothetical protein